MDFHSGDVNKRKMSPRQLDVFEVFESMSKEVANTKWHYVYYKKILRKCSELMIEAYNLSFEERTFAQKRIKQYYRKYKFLLRRRDLFITKERLSIWISVNMPSLYRTIKRK